MGHFSRAPKHFHIRNTNGLDIWINCNKLLRLLVKLREMRRVLPSRDQLLMRIGGGDNRSGARLRFCDGAGTRGRTRDDAEDIFVSGESGQGQAGGVTRSALFAAIQFDGRRPGVP